MSITDNFHKSILENLYDGVYVVDQNKKIIYWNQTCQQMIGYKQSNIEETHHCHELLNPIDESGINLCQNGCPVAKTLNQGVINNVEIYLRHKNGHRIPIKTKISPITDQQGTIQGAVQILANNSEKVALRAKLNRMEEEALLDKLTQVGNRKFIRTRLEERLKELVRYGWKFGVLFIDLDNFKKINDTYGHTTGDEILTMVARTIEKDLRSFDTVGRWGGDEFIAIIVNISSENLSSVATRLKNLISNSYLSKDNTKIKVTPSIGGTVATKKDNIEQLISRADDAMYESKEQGKNQVTIF